MTWRWWSAGLLMCCGLLGLVGILTYQLGLRTGRDQVKAQWELQRQADAALVARLNQQMRETEQGLQGSVDRIRKSKDEEVRRLAARYDAAVERLRQRASRPSDYLPAPTEAAGVGSGTGCGADQLYRQDAAVALGIARDADIARAALMECRAAYEAAQEALADGPR